MNTKTAMLKAGTKIQILGFPSMGGYPAVAPESATVLRPTKENLPLPNGYHVVKFDRDGTKICIHQSKFRVL